MPLSLTHSNPMAQGMAMEQTLHVIKFYKLLRLKLAALQCFQKTELVRHLFGLDWKTIYLNGGKIE
jgi:hypothetical protein